jgi:hypothetical protein
MNNRPFTATWVARLVLIACTTAIISACDQSGTTNPEPLASDPVLTPPQISPADRVNDIADRYYETTLGYFPEIAYFSGVTLDRHDGMRKIDPESRQAVDDNRNELLAELEAIDPALALRRQAEEAMGDDFDIREFHDRVLENGTIPLIQLRAHIEAWIAQFQAG